MAVRSLRGVATAPRPRAALGNGVSGAFDPHTVHKAPRAESNGSGRVP
jgi:hypothetical protein